MKDLSKLTEDELHELHMDTMFEITYSTMAIKKHENDVTTAARLIEELDLEMEKREAAKLELI